MLIELTEKENIELLKNNSIGRIGCTDGENIYIVPINYQYENNSIIGFSLEGLKIEMMRNHSAVCFEVDEIIDYNNWKSVVINGVFEEITNKSELDLLRPQYTEYFLKKRAKLNSPAALSDEDHKIKDIKSIKPEQLFYRIRFKNISGRAANVGFSSFELQ